MTREEILKNYNVNKYGAIVSPGKFEGEMLYVPYFFDLWLNGEGYDDDGDNQAVFIDIIMEDVKEFPELVGYNKINLYFADSGFIYGKTVK